MRPSIFRALTPSVVMSVVFAVCAVPAAVASALDRDSDVALLAAAQDSLSTTLGSTFGGAWLDSATGALVVGVTDPARASAVRAAGATPRIVRHSMAELTAAQSALDSYRGPVPPSVSSWYVDVRRNTVAVDVVRGDLEGMSWARRIALAEARAVGEPVRPTWNIAGGQWIVIGHNTCSVGFNAHRGGQRYVITAGHCTKGGRNNVMGTGGVLGLVTATSFPGSDYGLVWVDQVLAESSPRITRHSGSDVFVAGTSAVPVGGRICRSGQTSGWHCGEVTELNVTDRYDGGKNTVYGLTRTTACAESGDSGGAVVSDPRGSRYVQAQGVLSGAALECGDPAAFSDFQPIKPVLSRQHLSLYED